MAGVLALGFAVPPLLAQSSRTPFVVLSKASRLQLTGAVDSNSPAVWDLVDGVPTLHVVTSVDGYPSLATGRQLTSLGAAAPVAFTSHPGHGVWMEAVIADEGGRWYGFYHNEIPATVCDRPDRVIPRIGAMRSRDRGRTWLDLGIVIEAPPGAHECGTANKYFVGGVGDFSVALNREQTELYFFASQFSRTAAAQGVFVARMVWANRDRPAGRAEIWIDGRWQAPRGMRNAADGRMGIGFSYPAGTPLVAVTQPWHDANPANDAFWGPSVHWNTAIGQYVMLLNRTRDESWTQEGVYVSFAPRLDDPRLWTPPQRLFSGGSWYPQVMGLETGSGSDKEAGGRARFFLSGTSDYLIDFNLR